MGHLNVRFYVERAHEALAFLLLGVAPADRDGEAAVVVGEHIRFHREVRPSGAYVVRGGWLAPAVGAEHGCGQAQVAYLEMVRPSDGLVHATFLLEVRLARAPADGAVLDPLDSLGDSFVELPDRGAPRGIDPGPRRETADLETAVRLGMVPIHRRVFSPADGDGRGGVRQAAFMACLSDGIPHLLWRLRGEDRSTAGASGIGGAALEYRFAYRRPARVGDLVEVRSGLRALGNKTQHFVHWLLDPRSGAAYATAEAVAVRFDLEARRALPIDDAMRRRLEPQCIEGLTL